MDAVITYVNCNDDFIKEYEKYIQKDLNVERYRSYDVLDLQIKLIRKYLSFIKNIFIVISNKKQIEGIDTSDAIIITHEDIIPKEYLPCFNSCTIEMFLHKIPNLNEEFIYFNDDVFPIDYLKPTDFFIYHKPLFNPKTCTLDENNDKIFLSNLNNSTILASHLLRKDKDYKNKYVKYNHATIPLLKSSYDIIWQFGSKYILSSLTRTRHSKNYNTTLFSNYNYLLDKFIHKDIKSLYFNIYNGIDKIIDNIISKSAPIICINDNGDYYNFDEFKTELRKALEANLNDKKYVKLKEDNKEILNIFKKCYPKCLSIDIPKYKDDKTLLKIKKEEYKEIFDNDYNNFIKYLISISNDKYICNKKYLNEKGIISLTSWKNRINTVSKTIYSLLIHCINFHIVLVLSEDEFPNKEKELPKELQLILKNELIEILWVKYNYKAFKKVLFTINKYKTLPVISADDDCIYLYNYAENFYNIWKKTNGFVSVYKNETELGITLGGAATLYPPNIFKNYGLLTLDEELVKITNQDDDLYKILRKKLNLTNCTSTKDWNITYYFHDEINPLHDELKTLDRTKLANIISNKFDNNCKPIIVSITSYPKRIYGLHKSILYLINNQTIIPDEIHIWLSIEEFPYKENDLPINLLNLIDNKIIFLHWLEKNIYVHKRHEIFKYVNDAYVFFIDDDTIYNPKLIETVLNVAKKYPNTIITYNKYNPHIYDDKHIIYINNRLGNGPFINKLRWCGQSMIPANVYPKEILSDEYQKIRDIASPVSDECWFQPWIVYYNIPIYQCSLGWGKDLDENNTKKSGLVSWSHEKLLNGYERRDIWLNNVLNSIPKLLHKYEVEFNYSGEGNLEWFLHCEKIIPDLIKLYPKRTKGKILNFYNPQTINEKLNWMKIYDATYLKTRCCDKLELRNYCKEKIGYDLCVPILKTYNSFDEINFDELPDNYVLKTNHGSQTNIIVKNKNININEAKLKFEKWLSHDWTFWGYEMPYERIPRKIFVEKYMYDDKQQNSLFDYKFWCFNGEPKFFTINDGNGHGDIHNYDMNLNEIELFSRNDMENHDPNKKYIFPKNLNKMISYAKKFAEDFRFVRVDFYDINNTIYLGELTFYPGAGYIDYKSKDADIIIGNYLKI